MAAVAVALGWPWLLPRSTPLPPGVNLAGPPRPTGAAGVRLLADSTVWDPEAGVRVCRQEIFDEMLRSIREADGFIVADFFLWNDWQGAVPERHRALSSEFAAALLEKKRACPNLPILVLTDPLNRLYGEPEAAATAGLAQAGVRVIYTDLFRLRDSNLLYGPPVHAFCHLFGGLFAHAGWLDRPRFANPFRTDGPRLSLRQMSRLLLFKANHRKVLLTGGADGQARLLVTSLNPADASSAHSNLGLAAGGEVARDALASELSVMEWSLAGAYAPPPEQAQAAGREVAEVRRRFAQAIALPEPPVPGAPTVQWLTEGAIRERVLAMLDGAAVDDEVRIALFYLSDRATIEAMKRAAGRGAWLRLILDFNRDAFGRTKNGIPNRVVAAELLEAGRRADAHIEIRWADTHGEQFHPKAMSVRGRHGHKFQLLCGSANWTRRNLANINLEADLCVENEPGVTGTFNAWFDRAWGNTDGRIHTVLGQEQPGSPWNRFYRRWLYRFQESLGAGTF